MKITVVGHTAYDYICIVNQHPPLNHSSYITKWNRLLATYPDLLAYYTLEDIVGTTQKAPAVIPMRNQ